MRKQIIFYIRMPSFYPVNIMSEQHAVAWGTEQSCPAEYNGVWFIYFNIESSLKQICHIIILSDTIKNKANKRSKIVKTNKPPPKRHRSIPLQRQRKSKWFILVCIMLDS